MRLYRSIFAEIHCQVNREMELHRAFIVDFKVNETLQTGAVENRTYRVGLNSVRLKTAPIAPDKSGSKPKNCTEAAPKLHRKKMFCLEISSSTWASARVIYSGF